MNGRSPEPGAPRVAEPGANPPPGGFDAIVVGTGPGGGTVARELTGAGMRVLILEWGDRRPVTGSSLQALREIGIPGRGMLLAGRAMTVVRGITVGGSSIYYYGTAFDPPLEMLRAHGIDLAAEAEAARSELGVMTLPPELIGPLGTRIMQSARELGLDWKPLPKLFRPEHLGHGPAMGFYSAPTYEGKWNARMSVDAAVAGGATLLTGARVRRVLTEDGAARGVEYRRGGAVETARAPLVVVAAGGIGSPLILRASGIEQAGHDFFYDPLVCVFGELPGIESAQELPMQAGLLLEEEGYVLTDMMVPRTLHHMLSAQVGRFDRWPAYRRTATIMVKIRDELGGRLTARGMIRKPLTRADHAKLQGGTARAREILMQAGARHVFRSWYTAAHPGGTVKVGDLLDSDLQTSVRNLYVCDASVIPEAWGRPPTLTVVALAKRLAGHLQDGGRRQPAAAQSSEAFS
jgi:choline dehydrogenase-like flavoprotein